MDLYNKIFLVADSDATVRKFLLKRLTSNGYKVFIASNGNEVIKLFNRKKPNLVLLELLLSKLDGYEVCFKIRASSRVPIVIMTSLGKI